MGRKSNTLSNVRTHKCTLWFLYYLELDLRFGLSFVAVRAEKETGGKKRFIITSIK